MELSSFNETDCDCLVLAVGASDVFDSPLDSFAALFLDLFLRRSFLPSTASDVLTVKIPRRMLQEPSNKLLWLGENLL